MLLPPAWLPDPITAVYRAIRAALQAHQGFIALCTPGNFPDLSDKGFERFLEEVAPGRLAEVCLIQANFGLNIAGRNSMTQEIRQTFDVVITVDKLQVTPINAVKFHAKIALAHAGEDLGIPGGLVRDWNIIDGADDAFGQREWKRDAIRYVSAFRIKTDLSLPRRLVAGLFQQA